VTVADLFKAGVHYGHLSRHWNVAMFKYLYTDSNGTHVIDLVKTKRLLIQACNRVEQAAKEGKDFVFVGTKASVGEAVEEQAKKCNANFVVERWVGGTLTNWSRLRHRVGALRTLLTQEESGAFDDLSKKSYLSKKRQIRRLSCGFRGLSHMKQVPEVAIIVDPATEAYAVAECNRLGVEIIALTDTNCDPSLIDFPIPGNDDGGDSVGFILSKLSDAIIAGRGEE
jgi:small subunit ribosomal protein S2